MKAIIDGDILCYRAAFATEKMVHSVENTVFADKKEAKQFVEEFGGEITSERHLEPVENAIHIIKNLINDIVYNTSSSCYDIIISGSDNYRKQVDPEYKANRADAYKPAHLEALKKYLVDVHGAYIVPYVEADDVMGIVQYTNYANKHKDPAMSDVVMCTIDKDLDMIPGHHHNFVTGESYWIDDDQAMYCFYHQMLTGDATDNIKGIPKVGKKKADTALQAVPPDQWEMVVQAEYANHYGDEWEKEYEKNSKLLWICRNYKEPPIEGIKQEKLGVICRKIGNIKNKVAIVRRKKHARKKT